MCGKKGSVDTANATETTTIQIRMDSASKKLGGVINSQSTQGLNLRAKVTLRKTNPGTTLKKVPRQIGHLQKRLLILRSPKTTVPSVPTGGKNPERMTRPLIGWIFKTKS